MILIIAEKPSLARNISSALGKMNKYNGYLEGGGYIVSWAFGHLFSLADIETYTGGGGRWSMDALPCFPESFIFELRRDASKKTDEGVSRQFDIIRSLCCREDVDTVVNAGDSDREGEIIIRTCIEKAGISGKKVLKRLWLPDQTPETIRTALAEMKDESDYDSLANEGYARTYIDWLYGVNLTRYATLRTGTLLRVGRVIAPIVRAIYERDMAIKGFTPEKYYSPVSRSQVGGVELELVSKLKFKTPDEAAAVCERYNAAGGTVISARKKRDTLAPGKLYSLSKLQNVLGKKFKMSMSDSLAAVQKLYEAGYVTYPRTNSEYLATAERDKVKGVIEKVSALGYPVEFKDSKTIFDDKKIEAHSALTPTHKIPDKSKLSPDEEKAYKAIFRRFAAVFCSEPCVINRTEIKLDVGGEEEFTLKGSVIVEPGWTKYDDFTAKDKFLPDLKKGEKIATAFAPAEKETSPPKHYTIETLNNYLKNPFRDEKNTPPENGDMDEEEYEAIFEGLELGTEATRTGIIDNARKSGYIQLKGDVYTILPDGVYFVEWLGRLNIGMDKFKTAELGRSLKKVYRGEFTIADSTAVAKAEISEIFKTASSPPETDNDMGYFGDIAGKCPLCGSDVVRTKFGYGCRGYKEGCKFSVNAVICKRIISLVNVKQLLTEGKTSKITGFISKGGKPFDAALRLENGRVVFDFQ